MVQRRKNNLIQVKSGCVRVAKVNNILMYSQHLFKTNDAKLLSEKLSKPRVFSLFGVRVRVS